MPVSSTRTQVHPRAHGSAALRASACSLPAALPAPPITGPMAGPAGTPSTGSRVDSPPSGPSATRPSARGPSPTRRRRAGDVQASAARRGPAVHRRRRPLRAPAARPHAAHPGGRPARGDGGAPAHAAPRAHRERRRRRSRGGRSAGHGAACAGRAARARRLRHGVLVHRAAAGPPRRCPEAGSLVPRGAVRRRQPGRATAPPRPMGERADEDAVLLQGVVGLARLLGLQTVGGGVESAIQPDVLRGLACDFALGSTSARRSPRAPSRLGSRPSGGTSRARSRTWARGARRSYARREARRCPQITDAGGANHAGARREGGGSKEREAGARVEHGALGTAERVTRGRGDGRGEPHRRTRSDRAACYPAPLRFGIADPSIRGTQCQLPLQ